MILLNFMLTILVLDFLQKFTLHVPSDFFMTRIEKI